MRKTSILVLSLVLLLLAACRSDEEQPTATAVPAEEPTQEPTAVPPTAAPPTAAPTEVVADPEGTNRDTLLAQPWLWHSFQGPTEAFEIQNPQDYLLTFNQDGTVNVKADCNNAAGSFTADESSLTITLGPVTLAACPDGSRGEQFIQLLGGAAAYFFEGADLYIDLMADGGTMRFAPAEAVAVQPTVAPPTATPLPPTAVPPTATPQLPGSVVDSGPRQYASGAYAAPYYTVAAGDTLFSISQRFGVPMDQIAAANGLVNNAIYAGQKLLISSGSDATNPPTGIQYERVFFGAGGISATLEGVIVQGQPKGYVLGGQSGQVLEIGTTSSGEPLEVMVQSADGTVLPLNGENGKLQSNLYVPLPATGDYYVTITPVTLPESPSLAFTVTFIIQ